MSKTSQSLITANDGIQFMKADLFRQPILTASLVEDLFRKAGWHGSMSTLTEKLHQFDSWYIFELRELNGPKKKEMKNKSVRLAKKLSDTAGLIDDFDRDMMTMLGINLRNERSELKISDLKSLKAQALKFATALNLFAKSIQMTHGRESKPWRTEAATKLIAIWESEIENNFPKQLEIAKASQSKEFISPNMQFIFVILKQFEERLSVYDAKHAIVAALKSQGPSPK